MTTPRPQDDTMRAFARGLRADLDRLTMEHEFAVDEILTKVSILQREFLHLHRYNPIEHVESRVKAPEGILRKVARRGIAPDVQSMRRHITDIAGIRIICSFIADTYRVRDALTGQNDIQVIVTKDYIASPKPNGYKSLHVVVEVPVFLTTGPTPVAVEVQIRTIAMDFWASLEHKIHYKYEGVVPPHLAHELAKAAAVAEQLDQRMEQLHAEVHGSTTRQRTALDIDDDLMSKLWSLTSQST